MLPNTFWMILDDSRPEFCLLLRCFSSFFKDFHKFRWGFEVCFKNLADKNWVKFCKFSDAAQIILQVTENLTMLSRNKIEVKHIRFISTYVQSLVSIYQPNCQIVNNYERTSEVVVIESIEVRELLCFLYFFGILNKILMLQRKNIQ